MNMFVVTYNLWPSSCTTLILTKMNGWQEKNPTPELIITYSFIPIIFSEIMFSCIQEKI